MRAERLVMEGLAAATDRTGVDVIGDKGDHLGPIELAANVLDCLGDARVTSEAVIMAGVKDIQSGGLVVGHVKLSLVAEEVTILREAPWVGKLNRRCNCSCRVRADSKACNMGLSDRVGLQAMTDRNEEGRRVEDNCVQYLA